MDSENQPPVVLDTPSLLPVVKKSKLRYWILGFLALIICFVVYLIVGKSSNVNQSLVNGTAGVSPSQIFNFTISPDNKWLVALAGKLPEYGMFTLNLQTGEKTKFSLTDYNKNDRGNIWEFRDECWSADSKYCIFPVIYTITKMDPVYCRGSSHGDCGGDVRFSEATAEDDRSSIPRIILDLASGTPKVIEQDNKTTNPVKISDINPSSPFTCSDCVSLTEQYPNGISSDDKLAFNNARSSGAKTITRNNLKYSVIGSGSGTVKIVVENIITGEKKELYSASSYFRESYLDYLDLSADGLKLAFQESHGYGSFIGAATLKVLDIRTGKVLDVSDTVYYNTHWSTDSKRIYYYHCQSGGNCGSNDGIYYSDI